MLQIGLAVVGTLTPVAMEGHHMLCLQRSREDFANSMRMDTARKGHHVTISIRDQMQEVKDAFLFFWCIVCFLFLHRNTLRLCICMMAALSSHVDLCAVRMDTAFEFL